MLRNGRNANQGGRFLAILLALAMVFQQAGITTLAEELSTTETVASVEEETAAEETTKEAETTASAGETTETTAKETTAETSAPAAGSDTKDSSASEETSAPATETDVTEAATQKSTESSAADPSTEPESGAVTEASTEAETLLNSTQKTDTEDGIEASSNNEKTSAEAETETEAGTESVTEAVTEDESDTEVESEIVTEAETEIETDTEIESEVAAADGTEAEAQTETEAPKTYFTYSDSRVVITAQASTSANLPQGAQLKADYINPGSAAYKFAVSKIENQLGSELGINEENTETAYVLYDVYFVSDGTRIEPEAGTVTVQMSFIQAVDLGLEGEIVSAEVIHVTDDGEAQVVTDYVNVDEDGVVTSMGFTQESFSVVALEETAMTVDDESTNTNYFANIDDVVWIVEGTTENLISVSVSATTNGSATTALTDGASYTFSISMNFSQVDSSTVYAIDLSSLADYLDLDTSNIPTDPENPGIVGDNLGYYYLDTSTNTLYFTLTNVDASAFNITAGISLQATADASNTSGKETVTIQIAGESYEYTIYGTQSSLEVTKTDSATYDESTGTVTFTVTATSVNGKTTIRSLTDSFKLLALSTGTTVTVTDSSGNTVSSQTVSSGSSFTTTLDEEYVLSEGDYLTFTYTMVVDTTNAVSETNYIQNTATVNYQDNWDLDKSQSSSTWQQELTLFWPTVEKELVSETAASGSDPATVTWKITVDGNGTYLDDTTDATYTLDDSWNYANLVLSDFDNAEVTIYYYDETEQTEKSVTVKISDLGDAVTVNSNGKNFTIDFSKISTNAGYSNITKVEITYTTSVDTTADSLASGQSRTVTNTAEVERDGHAIDGDSEGTTVTNDSDSGLGVEKTHNSITDVAGEDTVKQVEWTTTLTVKAGTYSALKYQDTLGTDGYADASKETYWYWFDVSDLNGSIIKSIIFTDTNTGEEVTALSYTLTPNNLLGSYYQGFELDFGEVTLTSDITITITYVSYFDYSVIQGTYSGHNYTLKNTAKLSNGNDSVTVTDTISKGFVRGSAQKERYIEGDDSTGTIIWNVIIDYEVIKELYYNESNGKWYWPSSAQIVDVLPDNMTLVTLSDEDRIAYNPGYILYSTNGNSDDGRTDNRITNYSLNGSILTIDILDALKDFYENDGNTCNMYIVYRTRIVDYEQYIADGATTYTNEVTLILGDDLEFTTSGSEDLNPGSSFSKTAGSVGTVSGVSGLAQFTISGFQTLITNIASSNTSYTEAILVDEYGSGLRYSEDTFNATYGGTTIPLYDGTGTQSIYYTVDETTHTIEFHISTDSVTSDTITYYLHVVPVSGTTTSVWTNSVYLKGYEDISDSATVTSSDSSAWGSVSYAYLSVYKTGEVADSTDTVDLAGVTFKLYAATYTNGVLSYSGDALDEATTLSDGLASFYQPLTVNTLYAIVEDSSTTPSGYVTSDPIYVFYNYSDATGALDETTRAAYIAAGVEITDIQTVTGQTAYAYQENVVNELEEDKGSVTLTKYGANSEVLAGAEFDLYLVVDGSDDTKVNTDTLTTDENGQITVEDLEPGTYYFV
ncbi:MAG: hypothetical protein LUG99_04440, partial [Lachnospiraceae bacterium]|nr:hypothetical protein [Lachnospiraceae bacterium]